MPFKSVRQMKWAFANKKPWAQEWADKTPKTGLPERATPKTLINRIKKKLVKKRKKST